MKYTKGYFPKTSTRTGIIAKLACLHGGHNASENSWGRLGMQCDTEDDEDVASYFYHSITEDAQRPLKEEIQALKAKLFAKQMINRQIEIFKNLLSYAERNTCLHEETHRGGFIWEICDSCGMKWADDEGGKPKNAHEWPKEIEEAQNLLDSLDKEFPEITYELPENDNREIKQWYIDKTEKGYHVCLSIEEKMENFHCQPDKPLKKNFFDDSECFPKKMQEDILAIQKYQPEIIAIPILELENIVDALERGLENTQEVLIRHDSNLGRKNKVYAEQLEKDIEFLKARISMLKHKLVGVATHYP